MGERGQATMRDVARRARVSPATVSNVLGRRRAVAPELASRVFQAIAELDYRVDPVASQLRTGRARVVAVLVPSLENPFFAALVAAVERTATAAGFDIIVASAGNDLAIERARLSALLAWRPAGLVVAPVSDAFPAGDLVAETRLPLVVVDRAGEAGEADTVTLDGRLAGELVARHLAGLGHAHTLVVASHLSLANIRERSSGFSETCTALGLPAPRIIETGDEAGAVAAALTRALDRQPRPSAVFALTNMTTLGALEAAHRLGLAIPDDLSLVGFDDYAWMRAARPSITAVRQPVEEIGASACRRLLARLAEADAPAVRERLPPSLEVRESSRRAARHQEPAGAPAPAAA